MNALPEAASDQPPVVLPYRQQWRPCMNCHAMHGAWVAYTYILECLYVESTRNPNFRFVSPSPSSLDQTELQCNGQAREPFIRGVQLIPINSSFYVTIVIP